VGDLPSTDPILLPPYEARSHGFMVLDPLYGQTGAVQGFAAMPQMVRAHTVDDGGNTWTLTLRDGLSFHDGSRVLARDCVASIRRWGARDQIGQTLMQRIESLSSPNDRTISFRLTKLFVMLPEAIGQDTAAKTSSSLFRRACGGSRCSARLPPTCCESAA
jgi:peptide/nickel transport system substrate-binding protein